MVGGRNCEGFRMPAARKRRHTLRRPAYENLQRRKSREGTRGRCGALHGGVRPQERLNGSGYRPRARAQLRRSGPTIAIWGFKLSHHLSFQRVRRGKNSALENSCAISLTTSLQRHSANPWLSSFKSLAPSNRDGFELLVKRTFASPIE